MLFQELEERKLVPCACLDSRCLGTESQFKWERGEGCQPTASEIALKDSRTRMLFSVPVWRIIDLHAALCYGIDSGSVQSSFRVQLWLSDILQ